MDRVLGLSLVGLLLLMLALAPPAVAAWEPPPPPPDQYDWIQLKSGEWLKGKIKYMQKHKLEFDSVELEDQNFDWEDIKALRAPMASCVFGDRRDVFAGAITIDPKTVTIVNGQTQQQFSRNELRGLSPSGPNERDYWSGKIDIGGNIRSGNSNGGDVTVQARIDRRTPDTRLTLDYLANIGEVEGTETADDQRAEFSYDVSITQRFFARPVYLQYFRDPFNNIQHQGTIAAGAGYYLFDEPKLQWQIAGGPAFQYTKFDSVEAGLADENHTPGFVFGTRFEKALSKRVDLILAYQGILTSEDAGLLTHHAVATIEVKTTRVLDLDLSLVWDRTEEPRTRSDGTTPERDDFQFIVALGIKF